jgi:hypothetical protein
VSIGGILWVLLGPYSAGDDRGRHQQHPDGDRDAGATSAIRISTPSPGASSTTPDDCVAEAGRVFPQPLPQRCQGDGRQLAGTRDPALSGIVRSPERESPTPAAAKPRHLPHGKVQVGGVSSGTATWCRRTQPGLPAPHHHGFSPVRWQGRPQGMAVMGGRDGQPPVLCSQSDRS